MADEVTLAGLSTFDLMITRCKGCGHLNTHDRLLRAVLDRPHDDAPKLAFAEWLEAQGEAELANFFRARCRSASPCPDCGGTGWVCYDDIQFDCPACKPNDSEALRFLAANDHARRAATSWAFCRSSDP